MWGRFSWHGVPPGFKLPRPPYTPEKVAEYRKARADWEVMARSNTITEYGKNYFVRFASRAAIAGGGGPWFRTQYLESDDYLSWMAVGTGGLISPGNPRPPDPSAFRENDDSIQSYRGRGSIEFAADVDEETAPHAVELTAFLTGADIHPAIADEPCELSEAALVPYSSNNHLVLPAGNKVVAYCTFDARAMALTDRAAFTWIIGIS